MALHFAASAAEQEEEEDGAERERRLIGFRQRRVSRFGGRATSERVHRHRVSKAMLRWRQKQPPRAVLT